ncbi:hypothetical protein MJM28_28220, partial [Salmonella enterica subsp. enterica serovar Montevideo]|nr:hypothetical protein [Salmonella enterica subsp. enterica serovar Montevideo]
RLSDKLLKSSAASLFLSGAGCAYYAFPLQSQAFIFAFLREVLPENHSALLSDYTDADVFYFNFNLLILFVC